MSSTRAQINLSLTASEEFTASEVPSAQTASERTLKSGSGNNLAQSLHATSTPAVTKPPVSLKITIGGAPTTINLAAIAAAVIPPTATRTVDMTTAKLVTCTLRTADDNDGAVTIAPGDADPYPIFGAGKDIDMPKGMQIALTSRIASQLPAVGAAVKNVKISGTSGDELYIDMLFGT
jgi:hypothetical protein